MWNSYNINHTHCIYCYFWSTSDMGCYANSNFVPFKAIRRVWQIIFRRSELFYGEQSDSIDKKTNVIHNLQWMQQPWQDSCSPKDFSDSGCFGSLGRLWPHYTLRQRALAWLGVWNYTWQYGIVLVSSFP